MTARRSNIPDVEKAMTYLLNNRKAFIETLVKIEDKDTHVVPMVLNPIQSELVDNLTTGSKIIVVKPGQVGFSTIIILNFLIDVLTQPGTTAVLISYNEFVAQRILNKAHKFYYHLSNDIPSLPKLKHKSTYEIGVEDFPGSFYIGSANSFMFGRGDTIHRLVLDEHAFWQSGDSERIALPTIQRVPPSGVVVVGSTPNGEDNQFCEMYRAAQEGFDCGKSMFKSMFFPWTAMPEYSLSADSPYARSVDRGKLCYSEDELQVIKKLGATEDQIRWRRLKIAEMESLNRQGTTRLLFNQEYPEDDVTCFLAAGDAFYDVGQVERLSRDCYPSLDSHIGTDIWIHPEINRKYIVGVDPGMGKESKSVATVWYTDYEVVPSRSDPTLEVQVEKIVHCATLSGLHTSDVFYPMVEELCRFYNMAELAAEANLEFINYAKDYQNLYNFVDPMTGIPTNKPGWYTNTRTKPYMMTEVNRLLKLIECHDIRIVSQLRNIRWYNGRPVNIGADDYVMSTSIALVCRGSIPQEVGFAGESGWSW